MACLLQVGLITAVTYLTVAHTLPAVFCLRLLRRKQHWLDSTLQVMIRRVQKQHMPCQYNTELNT
jgi:hypothetical protein